MNDAPCRVTYDLNRYMAQQDRPERKRTQSERDQMIDKQAEKIYNAWMEDEMPDAVIEYATVDLMELAYDLRCGELNPQAAGNRFYEIILKSLGDLAVKQAEEWEADQ